MSIVPGKDRQIAAISIVIRVVASLTACGRDIHIDDAKDPGAAGIGVPIRRRCTSKAMSGSNVSPPANSR